MREPFNDPVLVLLGADCWVNRIRNGDQIGVPSKIEKWCDRMDALTDFPADQQFGGRINRSRCQQPRFQQIRGRCSPLKPVADGKSSTSAVVGVNVRSPSG